MILFREKIYDNILKYKLIDNGDSIIIGVSGGPDSMALLYALFELKELLRVSLYAVHVNHLLRGEESYRDENFVREFCMAKKIPLHVKRIDINERRKENSLSIEEAAREARYECFNEFLQNLGAKKIAIAHNLEDQTETIIMNIIRGCGVDGLCGMRFSRANIIRPMLNISRSEILKYCNEGFLNPVIDSSNKDTCYTRNKIRLELIPFIRNKFRHDIYKSIIRLSQIIKVENDFLKEYSEVAFNDIILEFSENQIIIDRLKFTNLHLAIKRRIARNIIKNLKGNLMGIENINIEKIIKLSECGNNGSSINLPSSIIVIKSYNQLRFRKDYKLEKENIMERIINFPDEIILKEYGKFIISINDRKDLDDSLFKRVSKSNEQYFDFDKIKGSLVIRARKEGDRIALFENKSSKKLKEYFIDNKVDRELRDNIPLIACGGEVLWIVGFAVTNEYKVNNNTNKVLAIKFISKNK